MTGTAPAHERQLSVSRLVLGGAPLGGLYSAVSEADAEATLQAAWDCGIRQFDTAPHYGVGLSEERFGRFLRQFPRNEFKISTKVGRLLVPSSEDVGGVDGFYGTPSRLRVRDYSAEGVRRSVYESLERLGLDRLDTALIHDPDEFEDHVINMAYPELELLQGEGLIQRIGVGMNQSEMLVRFVREIRLDMVMIAGRYTLLDQTAEAELFPECARHQTQVVVAGVYNSGVLADPQKNATFEYRPVPLDIMTRVQVIQEICRQFQTPMQVVALQFAMRDPRVSAVVFGARSASEVIENVAALDMEIPPALWEELRSVGVIKEYFPVATPQDDIFREPK